MKLRLEESGYVQEVLEEAKAFESLPEAEEEKGERRKLDEKVLQAFGEERRSRCPPPASTPRPGIVPHGGVCAHRVGHGGGAWVHCKTPSTTRSVFMLIWGLRGRKTPSVRWGMDSPLCSYFPNPKQRSQRYKYMPRKYSVPRVRAYRFRAYPSKTTARVLETQLEIACKLYNMLLHAEQEEYEKNKRTMSMNELRQLALDLRKQNPEFQVLHSQVAQQVADRFYEARQRFLDGVANKPVYEPNTIRIVLLS